MTPFTEGVLKRDVTRMSHSCPSNLDVDMFPLFQQREFFSVDYQRQ